VHGTPGVQADADQIAAKAQDMCLSPLKALPNPKMLHNF